MTTNETMKPSCLVLEDGSIFHGFSPTDQPTAYGEIVFSTGMTGYVESLTDPSYAGQILVFTYPLLGNYGVPENLTWESDRIYARGVVISELCRHWSHHTGKESFLKWLQKHNVPLLCDIDTRELTKKLRSHGTMLGKITADSQNKNIPKSPQEDFVAQVSIKQKRILKSTQTHTPPKKVIAVDCGMKLNILRFLQHYPIELHHVPFDYDYSSEDFDGVFLSNGPGDPQKCVKTISILQKAMERRKTIYGICLGAQIMALAAGAKTYKLTFGHRGHNQPCMDVVHKRCYITSQNHGYAIDENSLPQGWVVTFKNLNDGSVEGIAHNSLPFAALQFHPEAAPGPTDTQWFFNQFYQSLCENHAKL